MSTSSSNVTVDGHYLLASSIAGLIARSITHPMDTIKTRLQTTTETTIRSWNIPSLFKSLNTVLFHTEPTKLRSFLSLYRGLPVTLVFSVPALSVYLSCYETSKQALDQCFRDKRLKRDTALNHLMSGCFAEVSAGLLFTPMEVMKNRLQTAHHHHRQQQLQQSTGTIKDMALAKDIFRKEGLRGFYKGYWMGLVVFVPHSMAYFVTYEKMKQLLSGRSSNANMFMVSSSVAGIVSILLSTPLDIIKTRWQISAAEQGKAFRSGPVQIAKNMWIKEGPHAFVKGLWARMAWGIPTTAISMTIFELLK